MDLIEGVIQGLVMGSNSGGGGGGSTGASWGAITGDISDQTDLQAELGSFSNPNLLINGDFRINQRGANEYEANCYSVDRWQILNNTDLAVNDSGVTLTARTNATVAFFAQTIPISELGIKPNEEITLTLSVKTGDTNAESGGAGLYKVNSAGVATYLGRTDYNDNTLTIKTIQHTFSVGDNVRVTLYPFDYRYEPNETSEGLYRDFEWAKLEVGNKATPFAPKSYNQELADCKYYFEKITKSDVSIFRPHCLSGSTNFIAVDFATKRVIPAVTLNGGMQLRNPNTNAVDQTVTDETERSYNSLAEKQCTIGFSKTSTQTVPSYGYIANTDTYIDIDAEIY